MRETDGDEDEGEEKELDDEAAEFDEDEVEEEEDEGVATARLESSGGSALILNSLAKTCKTPT